MNGVYRLEAIGGWLEPKRLRVNSSEALAPYRELKHHWLLLRGAQSYRLQKILPFRIGSNLVSPVGRHKDFLPGHIYERDECLLNGLAVFIQHFAR